MTASKPRQVDSLDVGSDSLDPLVILFASPEQRCLGVPQLMAKSITGRLYLIEIVDEANEGRDRNIAEIRNLLGGDERIIRGEAKHSDPAWGLGELGRKLRSLPKGTRVLLDISTFPRGALLLTLRALERAIGRDSVTLLYTIPESYKEKGVLTTSHGLNRVTAIPTFSAPYSANEELVLIIFLGYEGDRALGLWQNVEPHRTIALLGYPSYNASWDGITEKVNAPLLAALDSTSIFSVDPLDPSASYAFLQEQILKREWPRGTNFYIAPLGTKPQAVGVYCFCVDHRDAATVVYASRCDHPDAYIAVGASTVWELPFPKGAACIPNLSK